MGGAEQYLKMVASYYKQDIVEVFFLQTSMKNLWENAEKHIHLNFPKNNYKLANIIKFLFHPKHRIYKTYDYIFTSHVYTTGIIGIMLQLNLIRKFNFVARESTSTFIRFKGIKLLRYKLFYWLGYKKVDLLICQTYFMKDQLIKGFPKLVYLTNIQVISNPIDNSLIKGVHNKPFNLKLPKKYIVSAGRLIYEKGYDILINSFYLLKQNYPELKLIILGDGDLRNQLISQAASLNLQNDVIFKGFVPNVYPFFKNASVCVVSSRVEGFPNVLLQMMSQNSKVVSTICAGGIIDIPSIQFSETNNQDSLEKALITSLESTTNNRELFDRYLTKRDISLFMNYIHELLEN